MGISINKKSVLRKVLDQLDIHLLRCPFADHYTKKLTVGAAITLFVEANLQQRKSLINIALNLEANKDLQEYVGFSSIDPSNLNRKLKTIPLAYLEYLFAHFSKEILRRKRGAKGIATFGKLSPVDSTTIRLPTVFGDWARFQRHKNGVKIHTQLLSLEANFHMPEEMVLSTVGVSDMSVVRRLVSRKDTTYIFDRGYVSYGDYRHWVNEAVLFVARLKVRTQYTVLHKREVPAGTRIVSDMDIELLDKKAKTTFQARLVQFYDEKKTRYEIITNRTDLTAEEIGEIYRCRWQIELFFKWMKQHLKTTTFYNFDPHAVWVQLYLALLSYQLCCLLHLENEEKDTLWNFLRKLRYYAHWEWGAFCRRQGRTSDRTSKGRRKVEGTKPPPSPLPKGMKRVAVK
ncbi:IS4 family transposase, partial [Paenibacillus luteus]|uniref:IS4 family transposase n=1 Tax=Paenibacillus luteus TaxID=2545753 RepID=UPI0011435051